LVDDGLWTQIEPLLPKRRRRNRQYAGRKPIPDRAVLTGILFVLREARAANEQALRSNPKSRTHNLEYIYLFSGAFARAEEAAKAWLREAPTRLSAAYGAQTPLMTGDLNLAEQRLAAGLAGHSILWHHLIRR
jgi:transposase